MAVDFGFKDIGLAVGEVGYGVGSVRPSIPASGSLKRDAQRLAEIATKEEVERIVLGLPIEESGQEGRMARIVRTLGGHLEALSLPVAFADESYSSIEAQQVLSSAGLRSEQREKLIHGESAMVILGRYESQAQVK